MHDTELEKILSSYKTQKPTKLKLIELIHDYKPVIGNTLIRGGDILIDLNGVDEEDVKLVFEAYRRTKRNLLTSREIENDINGDLSGIKIPKKYEKDSFLSYILRRGQEASEGLVGLERVRSIADKAYEIIDSNISKEDEEPERDGFLYALEYFFKKGTNDCFKVATIISLILSMDEELRKEGVRFRLGLRDLYIYDKADEVIKKSAENYEPHAWVNVYLKDKSTYILDEIYGVFADVASARKGVPSLEYPEKLLVYHFNPRAGIALRKLKKAREMD